LKEISVRTLECSLPDSIYEALHRRASAEGASTDHLIASALAENLGVSLHTLFQVSTSSALVSGLYQGAVRVSQLIERGDFGLGTFIDLNGEMVVLDGVCYQIHASGRVLPVEGDRLTPYAVVTRFSADFSEPSENLHGIDSLIAACDALRMSANVFYAFRIEGEFAAVRTRIMRAVGSGTRITEAAEKQVELSLERQRGTILGIWAPSYASAFLVPGYHFHFLSDDRQRGGHVLECTATKITISGCAMNDLHVSLPETVEFLNADLQRDPTTDLQAAEQKRDA
jgi:acetolactate decarboxylase